MYLSVGIQVEMATVEQLLALINRMEEGLERMDTMLTRLGEARDESINGRS